MRLPKILNKVFNRKTISTTTAIASLLDCINLPTREELSSTQENLVKLDKYKKEYSQILASKRTILSKDLDTTDYRGEVNMYIELLLNLLEDNDDTILSFENACHYKEGTKKINYMAKMLKLKAYYYNIEKLELETTLRLVALKEILASRFFLSPLKKRSIKEQMNNLASSLLIFINQRQAIHSEIEAYLKEYSMLDKEEFVESEIEQESINRKCQELRLILASLIQEDSKQNHPSSNICYSLEPRFQENTILSIALMEQTIEEYIYNHKIDASNLSEELQDKVRFIKEDLELEEMSPFIPDLERKLKAFCIYSRNLITEEDILTIYKIKFACQTRNIFEERDLNLATSASYIELECYSELITQKIAAILNNHNPRLKIVFPKNQLPAINAISTILKNDSSEYNFWNILNDKKLLGLIVAFDHSNGVSKYFDSIKCEPNNTDFHESIFTFDMTVPLTTIFSMMYYNKEKFPFPLYELYYQMRAQNSLSEFVLPEGLLYIDIPDRLTEKDQQLIKKIRETVMCSHDLETPKSLSEIKGKLYKGVSCTEIELNEGLQKLCEGTFEEVSAERLYIPSSLTNIDSTVFQNANMEEIVIRDFQNSNLTKESIQNLINNFYRASKVGPLKYHYVREDVKRKRQLALEGRYSSASNSELYDHEYTYGDFALIPTFSRLILQTNYQEVLSLSVEELSYTVTREYSTTIPLNRKSKEDGKYLTDMFLRSSEIDTIYYYIMEVIKNRLKELENSQILEKKMSPDYKK